VRSRKKAGSRFGAMRLDDQTLSAVIIGGLIAGVSNLALQWFVFRSQNKISLTNESLSAYNALLGHISNYESDPNGGEKFISDMGLYLSRAFTFGTPEIKLLIKPVLEKQKIEKYQDFSMIKKSRHRRNLEGKEKMVAILEEGIIYEHMVHFVCTMSIVGRNLFCRWHI